MSRRIAKQHDVWAKQGDAAEVTPEWAAFALPAPDHLVLEWMAREGLIRDPDGWPSVHWGEVRRAWHDREMRGLRRAPTNFRRTSL